MDAGGNAQNSANGVWETMLAVRTTSLSSAGMLDSNERGTEDAERVLAPDTEGGLDNGAEDSMTNSDAARRTG